MPADSSLQSIGSLLLMAFALGLDGFSVSMSIGLKEIRLIRMIWIGIIMGLFHFLLPFTGMVIGQFFSVFSDDITSFFGSVLLVFIGAYMFFSAWKPEERDIFNPRNTLHIFSVSLIVSIDSFPVGLSLGLYGMKSYFILFVIGFIAMIFAITGMITGRRIQRYLGSYSEMLGGIIIFIFGLKGLF